MTSGDGSDGRGFVGELGCVGLEGVGRGAGRGSLCGTPTVNVSGSKPNPGSTIGNGKLNGPGNGVPVRGWGDGPGRVLGRVAGPGAVAGPPGAVRTGSGV